MNNISHSSSSSSSVNSASIAASDPNVVRSRRRLQTVVKTMAAEPSRRWRDVFWCGIFMIHLILWGGLTEKLLATFMLLLVSWDVLVRLCSVFLDGAVLLGSCICNWCCHAVLVCLSCYKQTSFYHAGATSSCQDALGIGDGGRWWLLVVLSVSLFWTGAVLCNTVHVIVSGMVFLVLTHGGRDASSMPPKSLMKSIRYAVTTSFGSICYGSLFTAAIRTLYAGRYTCLHTFIRDDSLIISIYNACPFFNKYAYVQIAVSGKSFNHSARDAWELFQSCRLVEALIAYDCSGAVLLMCTLLGGLITGTCSGIWTWVKYRDRVALVGSTAMLMGMVLVGLAMAVVESAVTSIYICYAEDPLLIHRWDAEFFNQMSEMLHQRLQYRSARAREVLTHNRVDNHTLETLPF
ncbi:hypothetical protein M0R45_000933 [Rubus argutus]|uniref:Choline transporter-like protein n=1 Tax=Rubus argutus TaxID=59490 RepID=A0AAW1VN11_RUBAR